MSEDILSYQETEELLESIIINQTLYRANSKTGPQFVIFSHPTGHEFLKSRYRRELALLEATSMGLPSIEELEKTMVERNLKDPEDEKKIETLQNKISAQSRLLQLSKIEGRRKPIREAIEGLEGEIQTIKNKGDSLFNISADRKADEESVLYLAWVSTHTIDGDKYWLSFDDFELEQDIVFRNSILDGFLPFNRGARVPELRYLARHNLWRIRYAAALKLGGSLFTRGLDDLTPDQLALLYWSNYYQSIYEMLPDDQPDEDIISNDEDLDSFMESYFKRRDQERNEGKVTRRGGKNKLSAWDRSEEVIITAAHPDYMSMDYSEKRIETSDSVSDVEVVAPNSRRARNRAQSRLDR